MYSNPFYSPYITSTRDSKNHPYRKRLRALHRTVRRMRAIDRIPCGPVVVPMSMVKNHAYLRDHGLPHSAEVAALQPAEPRPVTLAVILTVALAAAALAARIAHQ